MEVSGKIKLIRETQTFGEKGFRKREMVITTSEQYPQMLMIEFVQDKCDLLDNYSVGQDVKIAINLRGRAKYFNSIQGWRIENVSGGEAEVSTPLPVAEDVPLAEEQDDLPF